MFFNVHQDVHIFFIAGAVKRKSSESSSGGVGPELAKKPKSAAPPAENTEDAKTTPETDKGAPATAGSEKSAASSIERPEEKTNGLASLLGHYGSDSDSE